MNFIYKAKEYAQKTAIVSGGNEYSYQTLFDEATLFAKILLGGEQDLNQQRVAFMVDPGFDYVKVQWAIWLAGGVAVPLCLSHPIPSLQYVMEDTGASVIVSSNNYSSFLEPLIGAPGIRYFNVNETYSNIEKELSRISGTLKVVIGGVITVSAAIIVLLIQLNQNISSL